MIDKCLSDYHLHVCGNFTREGLTKHSRNTREGLLSYLRELEFRYCNLLLIIRVSADMIYSSQICTRIALSCHSDLVLPLQNFVPEVQILHRGISIYHYCVSFNSYSL